MLVSAICSFRSVEDKRRADPRVRNGRRRGNTRREEDFCEEPPLTNRQDCGNLRRLWATRASDLGETIKNKKKKAREVERHESSERQWPRTSRNWTPNRPQTSQAHHPGRPAGRTREGPGVRRDRGKRDGSQTRGVTVGEAKLGEKPLSGRTVRTNATLRGSGNKPPPSCVPESSRSAWFAFGSPRLGKDTLSVSLAAWGPAVGGLAKTSR